MSNHETTTKLDTQQGGKDVAWPQITGRALKAVHSAENAEKGCNYNRTTPIEKTLFSFSESAQRTGSCQPLHVRTILIHTNLDYPDE